jgi:Ca2+-binding EF-hand superfamily protein
VSTDIIAYDEEAEDQPYSPPFTYVSRPRKRLDDARSQAIELMGVRPTSDERELRRYFELLDKDNTGALDRDEFKAVFASFEDFGLAPTSRQIDTLFNRYDTRRDGSLDFGEFCLLMIHRVSM